MGLRVSAQNISPKLLALIIALSVAATAYAGVLVIYTVNVSVEEVAPPIIFEPGANAGKPGLPSTNTITVSLGSNSTSATVSLQVTYGEVYIVDVLNIVNPTAPSGPSGDSYLVKLCADTAISSGVINTAEAKVYVGNNLVGTLDLRSIGCTGEFSLNDGDTATITFYFKLLEGNALDSIRLSVRLSLHYSPGTYVPSVPP